MGGLPSIRDGGNAIYPDVSIKLSIRLPPPLDPQYAMDTVTCEDAKEFTQEHLGETIVSTREVTLEEAVAQFRKDEPMFGASWDDETIIKNAITPIGYSEREKMREEEESWKNE